jgi:hypothetical protein
MTNYNLNRFGLAGSNQMDAGSDECRKEVAALFARGVLRLGPGNPCRTHNAKNSPESGPDPLDVTGETVLSVHMG